jgi:hypothetical protein
MSFFMDADGIGFPGPTHHRNGTPPSLNGYRRAAVPGDRDRWPTTEPTGPD